MSRKSGPSKRLAFFRRGNTKCPICLKQFSRTSVVKGTGVTLEHAPPRTLGGIVVCLTCKDCNAAAGNKIDQAVADYAKAESERKTGRGVEVEIDIGGTKLTTYLSVDKPMSPLDLARASRNEHAKKFIDDHPNHDIHLIVEGKRGTVWDANRGITMTVKKKPEPRHRAVSMLRTAYLLVFSLLGSRGYTYAESEPLIQVRDQIIQPDQDIAPLLFCDFSPLPEPKFAIGIQNSVKPHFWFVKVDSFGVILPHGGSIENYQQLIEFSDPIPIRSYKLYWGLVPFGRVPTFDLTMNTDSPQKGRDIFGQELNFTTQGHEFRSVATYQQGPQVSFATTAPTRKIT